ncbi:glycosyltransferase [Patescibacteria group bacterium]
MTIKKIRTTHKKFSDYRKFLTKTEYEKIKTLSKPLKKLKIIHINSTPKGGGVAEILKSLVPLEMSLGIDSNWYCIQADPEFFFITKKFHNGLQGYDTFLSDEQKKHYLDYNKKFADDIKKLKPDLLMMHDPQPLAVSEFDNTITKILRIHVDMSAPNKEILNFLLPYIKNYNSVILSLPEYVSTKFKNINPKIYISPPAIDPLTEKNEIVHCSKYKNCLEKIGINPKYPLIAQVSRFDIWKNPLGVIEAFYIAKKKIPNLQLILAGIIEAKDDPSAYDVLKEVKEYAKEDENIWVFHSLNQLKKLKISHTNFIKMIQNCANPILQLSSREGFGLTVTEAMWRSKILIGGNVGGIKFQIKNKKNGFLTDNVKDTAKKIIWTVKNPKSSIKMGKNAKEKVKKDFLITRLLADQLKIYTENTDCG